MKKNTANNLLILGGLAIAAYVAYRFFSGSSDYSFGGGAGSTDQTTQYAPNPPPGQQSIGPILPGSQPTTIPYGSQAPAGVILPSINAPIVQQTTSVITKGKVTQIGKPAYSGRTTPYIMPVTGTYQQQTQAQRINTILNPSLLKANIGMMVKPMTTAQFPVGTPQNPATPGPKGVVIPLWKFSR